MAMKECLRCGSAIGEHEKKCCVCGARQKSRLRALRCPQCESTIDAHDTRCQNCGYNFKSAAQQSYTAHSRSVHPSREHGTPPVWAPPGQRPAGQNTPRPAQMPRPAQQGNPLFPPAADRRTPQSTQINGAALVAVVLGGVVLLVIFLSIMLADSDFNEGYQYEQELTVSDSSALNKHIENGEAQLYDLEELDSRERSLPGFRLLLPRGWYSSSILDWSTAQSAFSPLTYDLMLYSRENASLQLFSPAYYAKTGSPYTPAGDFSTPMQVLSGFTAELETRPFEEKTDPAHEADLRTAWLEDMAPFFDAFRAQGFAVSDQALQFRIFSREGETAEIAVCSFRLSKGETQQLIHGVPFARRYQYDNSSPAESLTSLRTLALNLCPNQDFSRAQRHVGLEILTQIHKGRAQSFAQALDSELLLNAALLPYMNEIPNYRADSTASAVFAADWQYLNHLTLCEEQSLTSGSPIYLPDVFTQIWASQDETRFFALEDLTSLDPKSFEELQYEDWMRISDYRSWSSAS